MKLKLVNTTVEPTQGELLEMPESVMREWQVDLAGARRSRSRIYALNRENVRWRWRTLYSDGVLHVFKFERW